MQGRQLKRLRRSIGTTRIILFHPEKLEQYVLPHVQFQTLGSLARSRRVQCKSLAEFGLKLGSMFSVEASKNMYIPCVIVVVIVHEYLNTYMNFSIIVMVVGILIIYNFKYFAVHI